MSYWDISEEDKNYHSLRSLIAQYLEGYLDISLADLKNRIQSSYEEDYISGTGYDSLMGLLEGEE